MFLEASSQAAPNGTSGVLLALLRRAGLTRQIARSGAVTRVAALGSAAKFRCTPNGGYGAVVMAHRPVGAATDRRLCAVFAASRPLMFCALVGVLSPSGSLRNARHLATGRARPDR
jgi:hypothetical protein